MKQDYSKLQVGDMIYHTDFNGYIKSITESREGVKHVVIENERGSGSAVIPDFDAFLQLESTKELK